LVADDYRRIRAFGGRGGFIGYIKMVVDRLLIDAIRSEEAPRRRLPAAVEGLGPLEQAVFKAVAWQGQPQHSVQLADALRGTLAPPPGPGQVAAVLERLRPALRAARTRPRPAARSIASDGDAALEVVDPGPTPEQQLLDEEEERGQLALSDRVRQAAASLPTALKAYVLLVLDETDPTPAREIARRLGLPVEEVYRLAPQAVRWLKSRIDPQT
jgi:RNA polymerase primary sigma factor